MNPLAYTGKGSRIGVQTIPGQGAGKNDHAVVDEESALNILPQIIEKIT
jgi:hypothetical protein